MSSRRPSQDLAVLVISSQMARGTVEDASQVHQPNHVHPKGEKAPKRRCVQFACVPCRKRKSKCDGGTPTCATCTAVYKTACHYDPASESRRVKAGSAASTTTGSKREASCLVPSTSTPQDAFDAEFIINFLRKLPEEHVHDFVHLLRKGPKAELATLVETWRKTKTLPAFSTLDLSSLGSNLSMLLGKPAMSSTAETRHSDHPFIANCALPELRGSTWTTVTNDLELVDRLMRLYFTWSHSFYVIFSRECFYKDFRSGREKYCSPLLVNAISAYAYDLTHHPAGRADVTHVPIAGNHFFTEARRLLHENDGTSSLTTVQALCVMAMRELSRGKVSVGFQYMGRCMRMCVELGMHLNNHGNPVSSLTASEVEVRKVTFWGCFTADTVYSLCTERISQLPRAAITLEKPILEETTSLPDASVAVSYAPHRGITTRVFLQEFTSLSELINDNNSMYFAPQEWLTSSKLQNSYDRYQAWYRHLPTVLSVEDNKQPEPHVLVLHMLYFTAIVHLFRPLLDIDLVHSDVRPSGICIDAANATSRIVKTYRSLYDLRVTHLTIPHVLLSVCAVHLRYSKDNEVSRQNLNDGLHDLEDLHECHYLGAENFVILYRLSQDWDRPFPEQHQNSKLIMRESIDAHSTKSSPMEPLLMDTGSTPGASNARGLNMLSAPNGQTARRESLSMFEQSHLSFARHYAPPRPNNEVSSQRLQSPVISHIPMQNYSTVIPLTSYAYSQPMATSATAPASSADDALFCTSMPSLTGPLLAPNAYQSIGPVGLDSRDSSKMTQNWRHDRAFSFHSSAVSSVYGAAGPHAQHLPSFVHRSAHSQTGENVGFSQSAYQDHQDHQNHQDHQDHQDFTSPWWQASNQDPAPTT